MYLTRHNSMGEKYTLTDDSPTTTKIQFKNRSIIVNHPIEQISQSWFNWTVKGKLVQHAFDYLTPSEREFLITGITEQEWNRLMQ